MGRCLAAPLAFALLAVACRGESDQASRALPAPEPPASTPPLLAEQGAPAEKPKERAKAPKPEDDDEPSSAPAPANEPATEPASTATATATPSALPAADSSCIPTCQASLQSCLSQVPADADGGTNLDGLASCKRALDECKAKCQP